MIVSGCTFIRNGVTFDYPFLESISSLLPLVDELVIAVGDSHDDTRERILSLASAKIVLIDTIWDPNLRSGGEILSQQTNCALEQCRGDWALYLQGDEVFHERDFDNIRSSLTKHLSDTNIEGLLFDYTHFYGSYGFVGHSRKWYRNEVRAVRNGIGVRSWRDAQGFRKDGKKLRVVSSGASVYHYGWVKPPKAQQEKQKNFHKFWHSDDWVREYVGIADQYSYDEGGRLRTFTGSHPAFMKERVASQNWSFTYDERKMHIPLRDKVLDAVEDVTGWRPGEYRNYELIT
ncbi:MAG: glycosyl transferase [Ignavibacteria bacterium GWA2_55_11]|nr:MAG: glycosyl transferase [Ignavibacteria bacterium GWA2_55_11]OGU74375.1 MAG: glycosyl transferase [Ignavibacteria bacterium RIFCSPLOWO2_12_FULL_56_21]OGU75289.1 MAG: glycosyl transferase [Ignavibacteria bacterium RIFCSPLOWO2_02_FULL_55_14]